MKYDITLKQQIMIEHKLNVTQFAILYIISIAPSWATSVVFNDEVYYWTARQKIATELEAFDLKYDTVYRHLMKLDKDGFINYKKVGKKDFTRLTSKAKSIFSSVNQNKPENYYIGKKSEKDITAMSEKSPRKHGKKSENGSEKNPTDNNTNLHTHTINSSSLFPPILEEDENALVGCEIATKFDPYEKLPEHIDGLAREIVIQEIENMTIELGGDFEKYRNTLIQEVLSGQGRTITNIRARLIRMNTVHQKPWVVTHRKKREEGEKLQAFMLENGYDNIFDLIEEINQSELTA
ncbi:hypothetical protein [uncultured Sulfuricurvum sp.]|uniref:hypothetical protein n=1 Tax=uncultured Sulfuricurvum sp. TaxID=430693 RepID=UPI00261687F7|nr:hypothetical protein [uncultured Sulfuricurvum sp.]